MRMRFVVLTSFLALGLSACGDDDYGRDLGYFSSLPDGGGDADVTTIEPDLRRVDLSANIDADQAD